MSQVLIVEDEVILAKNLRSKLSAHGYQVAVEHSAEAALKSFSKSVPDLVLLDIRLPGMDGMTLLPKLRAESPSTAFIVMTAHGNERLAVEAMKAGACEYLTKPIELDELLIAVERAVEQQRITENLSYLRSREEQRSGLDRIIGESAATLSMKEAIRRLTRTTALALADPPTVLITGETGSGKDLVARAIHYEGPRRTKPFIQVNCTALPSTLFESELFGHVSGAFTSASKAKRGLFEVAEGGTLFLDEIGHLEPDVQAKLLLAVERREIRPVGATESRSINVHVIAATNRNLEEAVSQGGFRRDLYHRLRVIEFRVVPLRERREDIAILARHFLGVHCGRFGMNGRTLSPEAMERLDRHAWPGNVRELSHLIESAVLQTDHACLEPSDLHLGASGGNGTVEDGLQVRLPDERCITLDFEHGSPSLEEVEQTILRAAFEHWGRNLSRAARSLGVTREALRYRLNKGVHAGRKGTQAGCEAG